MWSGRNGEIKMRGAVHCAMGVLLVVSAVYLSRRLILDRDLLVLAAVSPAILAAIAFGTLLLVRVFRKG